MKSIKLIACILLLALTLSACKTGPLPSPDFPLSQAVLQDALEDTGLDWWSVSVDPLFETQSAFGLYTHDGNIASILSAQLEEDRYLLVGFSDGMRPNTTVGLPKKQWEAAFALASRLYGGFQSDSELFAAFPKDEPELFEEQPVYLKNATTLYNWSGTVNGTHCLVSQWMDDETQDFFLYWIILSSSSEIIEQTFSEAPTS